MIRINGLLITLVFVAAILCYGTLRAIGLDCCRLVHAIESSYDTDMALADDNPTVIKITAEKFDFTPDRIVLKKGQPVTFQLTSLDVVHGFMIRPLDIDTDIPPGKITEVTVTPEVTGTYRIICDHYCGLGHGGMKMTVVIQ